MMRRSFATALFALCTVGSSLCLFPSCSDDSKSAAQLFFSDYCDQMSACCVKAGISSDAESCKSAMFYLGAEYDPTTGATCLEEMRQSYALDGTCSGKSCNSVFKNNHQATKNLGESCESTNDCVQSSEGEVVCGFSSTGSSGNYTGFCQIRIKGKDGDSPCIGTNPDDGSYQFYTPITSPAFKGYVCYVADGLYCSKEGACSKAKPVGESCTTSFGYECGLTGYCEYSNGNYTCHERIAQGSPCTNDYQCQAGNTCDNTSQKCKALLQNGSACISSSDCQSSFCNNKVCSASGSAAGGLICFH